MTSEVTAAVSPANTLPACSNRSSSFGDSMSGLPPMCHCVPLKLSSVTIRQYTSPGSRSPSTVATNTGMLVCEMSCWRIPTNGLYETLPKYSPLRPEPERQSRYPLRGTRPDTASAVTSARASVTSSDARPIEGRDRVTVRRVDPDVSSPVPSRRLSRATATRAKPITVMNAVVPQPPGRLSMTANSRYTTSGVTTATYGRPTRRPHASNAPIPQNTMARIATIPDRGITGAMPLRITSLAKANSFPSAGKESAVGKRNHVVCGTAIRNTVSPTAAALATTMIQPRTRYATPAHVIAAPMIADATRINSQGNPSTEARSSLSARARANTIPAMPASQLRR